MPNPTLNAGRLRHRVDIQQRAETQDQNTGAITYQWVDFATKVAAEISPLSAKEFIQSAAEQSQITTKIVMRYRAGVVAKMRVVHIVNGVATYYNIAGVLRDPISGLDWMTLPCSTGVNDG